MTRSVFVSGCYDLLHGGHVQFLRQAKELGDYLIVCLPSDKVVANHRKRNASLPLEQKLELFRELRCVDQVCIGEDETPGLNFASVFKSLRPDVLAVGTDDRFEQAKRVLCSEVNAEYIKVPKSKDWPEFSTTELVRRICSPAEVPLRVDFAGGWLDVPKFSQSDSFIVNCAIRPTVSQNDWFYHPSSGLGSSAAFSLLEGCDPFESERRLGVGWQDPAVILETGLCVWKSGPQPVLHAKLNPDQLLSGRLALYWTGNPHHTPSYVDNKRSYERISMAGTLAKNSVLTGDFSGLCEAVTLSYAIQLKEGMSDLPGFGESSKKYLGGGWGGYALYMFAERLSRNQFVQMESEATSVEPYLRGPNDLILSKNIAERSPTYV
jgi:cytidyltransferase-like protein